MEFHLFHAGLELPVLFRVILNFLSFCFYFLQMLRLCACMLYLVCVLLRTQLRASYVLSKHSYQPSNIPNPKFLSFMCYRVFCFFFFSMYMCILSNELSCSFSCFFLGLLQFLVWSWVHYVAPEAGQYQILSPSISQMNGLWPEPTCLIPLSFLWVRSSDNLFRVMRNSLLLLFV